MKKRLPSEENALVSLFGILCWGGKCGCELHFRDLSQESIVVREAGLIMVEGGSADLSSLISMLSSRRS